VPALTAVAFVLLMCVGAGAALWVFQGEVARTVAQWKSISTPPVRPR
jgi:hypothetical protein